MTTVYPSQIDTVITLPSAIDNSTPVEADTVNRLRDAIIAIENTLGTNPQSIYTTVRNRLDVLEALIHSSSGVIFSGDLSGTNANQTVIGLQGNPVSNISPSIGQVLGWNGSSWAPTIAGAAASTFLIYRPGGVASGNVYTSWTALFAARAANASTPVTIVIDDSIVSPADTDPGTWALNRNTAIVGYKGYINSSVFNLPILRMGTDSFFTDPVYFANLIVEGEPAPADATPNFSASGVGAFTQLEFEADNVKFVTNQSSTMFLKPLFLIPNAGGTVSLRGISQVTQVFFGIPVFADDGTGNIASSFNFHLYDQSFIANFTLAMTANINSAGYNIFFNNLNNSVGPSQPQASGVIISFDQTGTGSNVFIYQPSGPRASANIYTSWTALMTSRNNFSISDPRPAKIIIDPQFSGGSVTIDTGVWDLGENTELVGTPSGPWSFATGGNFPVTIIGAGTTLRNLSVVRDLVLLVNSPNISDFAVDSGGSFSIVNIDFHNVLLANFGSGSIINSTANMQVTLYGNSEFYPAGPVLVGSYSGTGVLHVEDWSVVADSTISLSGASTILDVFIDGVTATVGSTQITSGGASIIFESGTLAGSNWSAAANGTVLTKTGPTTTSWQTSGGGITLQNAGSTVTGSPFTTINLQFSSYPAQSQQLAFFQQSGSTANIKSYPVDSNEPGIRLRKRQWSHQLGNLSSLLDPTTIGIPITTDSGVVFDGINGTVLGDNFYFAGFDTTNSQTAALYGLNVRTNQSITATNTPIHNYSGVSSPRVLALTGIRATNGGAATDYVFATVHNGGADYVELGSISNGVYTQIYQTFLTGGNQFANGYGFSAVIPTGFANTGSIVPDFVFVSDFFLWVATTRGGNQVIQLSPSFASSIGNLHVDDRGYVYVLESIGASNNIRKTLVTYNGTSWTYDLVATQSLSGILAVGERPKYLTSDGRNLLVMTSAATIYAYDLNSFEPYYFPTASGGISAGSQIFNAGFNAASAFGADPLTGVCVTDVAWDGFSMWCSTIGSISGTQYMFLCRFNPMTGQPEFVASTGLTPTYYPRKLVIDDSGHVIIAVYNDTGPSFTGKLWFLFADPVLEDAQFEDITLSTPPQITPFRANNIGTPYTLTKKQSIVFVDVSVSAVTLTLPSKAPDGFPATIKNNVGDASVNNITVNAPSGTTIESLASPGTFGSSAIINLKGGSVTWMYDATLLQWAVI